MKLIRKEAILAGLRTRCFKPNRRVSGFFPLVACGFTLSLILFFIVQFSEAGQIRIAWDPNTEEDLTGYRVYYGTASRDYGQPITIGKETTYTITDLTAGQRYYIAVTAFDTANNESDYSNEVNGIAPDTLLGKWDVDLSGDDRGGAVLWFEEHTKAIGGYGISTQMQLFGVEGSYSLDPDGSIQGTCTFYDLEKGEILSEGHDLAGEIRNRGDSIKIRANAGGKPPLSVKMKGKQFFDDESMPEDWVLKITGTSKGKVESLTIELYEDGDRVYPHLFRMAGAGTIEGEGPIEVNGTFFLTQKNNVYGTCDLVRVDLEKGFVMGRLDPVSGRFKFRVKGERGSRYIFVGQVKTDPG